MLFWLIWTLVIFYTAGFILCLFGHLVFLHMVTPGLAFVRSLVWPIYLLIGWVAS